MTSLGAMSQKIDLYLQPPSIYQLLIINCFVLKLFLKPHWKFESISDCNGTWTHNHLVRKGTLKHLAKLAKWLRCVVSTYTVKWTVQYLQHSSTIWPVWLNSWVFLYELSGCGFKSRCSNLNFRFHACFEQGVPWHSGNYRVWIHSETRTWHDKNIQSIWKYVFKINRQLFT